MSSEDGAWLDAFVDARPISSNGSFRIVACRDARTARRVVVVTPDRHVDPDVARVALQRLHHAHSTIEHFAIAPATRLSIEPGEKPYVVFDVPAQLDLQALLGLCRRNPGYKVKHAEGDAFAYSIRQALSEAARHTDPADGGPVCVGALNHASVLFSTDGRFWLLGLGHNVATCDEHGRIGGRQVFAAPEVLVGARPSPVADYIALIKFGRSTMEFSHIAPVIVSLLKGAHAGVPVELVKQLMWLETEIMAAPPHQRASVEEAVEGAWKIRHTLGTEPDLDGFQKAAARVIHEDGGYAADCCGGMSWRVAADGSWIARGDRRLEVRGTPMRRLLSELLRTHTTQPGKRLSVADLVAAGWPGERVRRRAGANRVYVAINGLRRSGLGSDLESEGGYRLTPAVVWERAGDPD